MYRNKRMKNENQEDSANDFTKVMAIYAQARAFMAQTGNPAQWGDGYPEEDLIREDIEKGISYVSEQDSRIETVFVFFQ